MPSIYDRRKFLRTTSLAAGTSVLVNIPDISLGEERKMNLNFTVREVIDIILKEVPNFNRPTTFALFRVLTK